MTEPSAGLRNPTKPSGWDVGSRIHCWRLPITSAATARAISDDVLLALPAARTERGGGWTNRFVEYDDCLAPLDDIRRLLNRGRSLVGFLGRATGDTVEEAAPE